MLNLIVIINFIILLFIAFKNFGLGSDNHIYNYYVDVIRGNKNKYFTTFPNFLNKMEMVDPQLLLKFFSFLNATQVKYVSILINPILSSFVLLIFGIFLESSNFFKFIKIDNYYIFILVAATPQYFFLLNARLMGLSARSVGMILIIIMLCALYLFELNGSHIYLLGAIFAGFLIWNTSLFAQQVFLFLALGLGFIFGKWYLFLILILTVTIFIISNFKYSIHFFIQRAKYFHIYAKYMANDFLLKHRYSIWRDWVWDFYKMNFKSFPERLKYIYANSIFQILFLNPLCLILVYAYFSEFKPKEDVLLLYTFCQNIGVVATFCFILTSFRITRFLGEPERYVEIISPFITIAAVIFLTEKFDFLILRTLIYYFVVIDCFQIITLLLVRNNKTLVSSISTNTIDDIKQIVNNHSNGKDIRFLTNNYQQSKLLINIEWSTVFFYPTAYYFGKYHIKNILSNFPLFHNSIIANWIITFHINYILFDTSQDWVEFQKLLSGDNMIVEVLKEDSKYKLCFIKQVNNL